MRLNNPDTFNINNRRYLGGKTKLLEFIQNVIRGENIEYSSFIDLFAGTGVVGNHFNKENVTIISNDLLHTNYHSMNTFLGNGEFDELRIQEIISHLNNKEYKTENYFSENYGNTFFTIDNARRIGGIREEIEILKNELTVREYSALLTSLIYATDKVANTFGHYEAFRKKLDTTSELMLKAPKLNAKLNANNQIYREDANALISTISGDILYIDPPYNSRQYVDAYHLLENLILWTKPSLHGVAKKMKDREYGKSNYCTVQAAQSFEDLIQKADVKYILVSYNNMGTKGTGRSQAKISDEEFISILEKKGKVKVFSTDFKYFTTGLSTIAGHQERIFFCKVKEKYETTH